MIDPALVDSLLSDPPREHERIDLAVDVVLSSGAQSALGVTENVSESGAFVRVPEPLGPGTDVHVRLRLPDGELIETAATVRWRQPSEGRASEGVGLQFVNLPERMARGIRSLASRRSDKNGMAPDPSRPATPSSPRGLPTELATRFSPIIRSLALRVARRLPPYVSVEDLVGAGLLGLVDAYRLYVPERNDRFEPYAMLRIRGAMVDELRSRDVMPRALRTFANKRAEATDTLRVRLRRAPSEAEVAVELGIPLAAFQGACARIEKGLGASPGPLPTSDGAMALRARSSLAPDELLQKMEAKRAVLSALDALPPRLQRVVELYYADDRSLREIGALLGVTESRVCQLHAEALQRIRAVARVSMPPRRSAPHRQEGRSNKTMRSEHDRRRRPRG